MDEEYLKRLLDDYSYNIQDYRIKDYNINYNNYRQHIEEIIQTEIEKQRVRDRNQYKFPNHPLAQTDEEKLEAMDIAVIERFLRKKKLIKLNNEK